MITENKAENFDEKTQVVGCIIEVDEKILLLHRQDHKPEGDTWGTPSGKVDVGESLKDAVIRETKEETGIRLDKKILKSHGKFFVRYEKYEFVYHLFYTKLNNNVKVQINPSEHKDFKWVKPSEALKMNLIEDEDICIKKVYKNLT